TRSLHAEIFGGRSRNALNDPSPRDGKGTISGTIVLAPPSHSNMVVGKSLIWRRERDSNPRNRCRFSGFQDHRHRPLGHLSARSFSSTFYAASPFHRVLAIALCSASCPVRKSSRAFSNRRTAFSALARTCK